MSRPTVTERPLVAPAAWESAVCAWPDDEARDWSRRLIDAALKDPAVEAVVATGSAVRDVDHSDDLDLVLVYRTPRPALPRPPISVDLRCYEHADAAARVATGHSHLSWAVRFGRVLFERDGWWSQFRARWNDRLLLPSAEESDGRARRAEQQSNGLAAAGDEDAAAELHLAALTHRARAALTRAGVFPQSRPELPIQLRAVGEHDLSERLQQALTCRRLMSESPVAASHGTTGDGQRM